MKSPLKAWAGVLAIFVMGLSLTSCPNHPRPVSRADYSTAIVGNWQGTVGNSKETMSLTGDGTFVCQLQPMGFISTMLFPRTPGTIRGTWTLTGTMITLKITAAEHERLENKTATSTLVSFNQDALVLKSDRGETSSFVRVRSL